MTHAGAINLSVEPATEGPSDGEQLGAVLERIAAAAARRDREPLPRFPAEAIAELELAGAMGSNAVPGTRRPPAAAELSLVRAVACADASIGRIFDGHLNGVERLAVQAPAGLREAELEAVRAARLRVGVWGADPRPGEGSPARVVTRGERSVLRGVKTFCSGAGGLDRALVLARAADPDEGRPVAVWIDLTDPGRTRVDEGWYRGSGLRASVSHRVVFDDAPVLAQFGGPGALSDQPWFARDALRTAASWAGMADAALDAALEEIARRPRRSELEELAAGRMLTAQQTIDAWLERGAAAMDRGAAGAPAGLAELSIHARAAISSACGELLDEAARACGSHPFASGGRLDRARRDLQLFLLQHRLDPGVTRAGAAALDARAGRGR